jgi:NAD(P)-dependent dehydrogenase (short-subunit alcohol dehydrogenase family)
MVPDRLRGKPRRPRVRGRILRPGWGNGKAAAVAYAREGARVVAIDVVRGGRGRNRGHHRGEGGVALAVAADVTDLPLVEAPSRRPSSASGASTSCTTTSA